MAGIGPGSIGLIRTSVGLWLIQVSCEGIIGLLSATWVEVGVG